MFVCTDVQLDRERAAAGELCPTGPIVGERMRQPEAEAHDLEQRIILPRIEGIDLHRARSLGEGTRRALRLRVTELSHTVLRKTGPSEEEHGTSSVDEAARSAECAMKVRFVLPKGAYATTVLSNVIALVDPSSDGGRDDRERESTEEE
jgi:tRNA pseudouridine13 synthase